MNEEIITAVDIGSSKIFALSGILRETGLEVVGAEVLYPSEEVVKNGRVVDIEGLSNYLYEAFESLKRQTGSRIEWVLLGIGGGHIKGRLLQKMIKIEPNGRRLDDSDLQNLEREIRTDAVGENESGRKLLHLLSQEYIVDGQSITKKTPIGLHGNTLEAKVHLLTGSVNPIQDLVQCVRNAGAEVEKIFPHAWAVAEATLNEEERKLGSLVIDFGKGTTDVALYIDNMLVLTESFWLGGGNIDTDISLLLHTPLNFAEDLKKNYGWCNYESLLEEKNPSLYEQVEIFTPTGKLTKQATVEKISKIVYERVREILEDFIKLTIQKNSYLPALGGGIVIAGGSSRLKGLVKFAEEIFGQPARIGMPKKILGLDKNLLKPAFSAGIGLLLLAGQKETRPKNLPWWKKIREKASNWI